MLFAQHDDSFQKGNPLMCGMRHPSLHEYQRSIMRALVTGVIVGLLLSPVHAEEPPATTGKPSPAIVAPPAAVEPTIIDPLVQLRGSVWRTKAGIVFLRTPVGLLSLSSKTTLKDLKASHEVHFWVHERHAVVEIRKRTDGSLVHRYLSGPMTAGTEEPNTLRWWGPDGDEIVHVGTEEARLANYHEGDPLTVEVDDTNTLRGVHDLQFDLQVSQIPPAGADVQLHLSGTVSKLKSNFVLLRTAVGLVMLNTKIGIPPVKVGQPLTVHIDHEHVTITLPSAKAPISRPSASPVR